MKTKIKDFFRKAAENKDKKSPVRFVGGLLSLASFAYTGLVRVNDIIYRKGLQKSRSLPVKVISVGNITWGGTGKTPFVEYLSAKLLEIGKKPFVLTRGYGDDEAAQLRAALPAEVALGVGKNRYEKAKTILEERDWDAAILDDGFQHRPLKRDLDIVLINALNPFGNGKVIPAGILREPINALKRADIIVITNSNLVSFSELRNLKESVKKYTGIVDFIEAVHEPLYFYEAKGRKRVEISEVKGREAVAFSAIATPQSFSGTLKQADVGLARTFDFLDHYKIKMEELANIKRAAKARSSGLIVTTEKDLYRDPETISEVLNPLVLKVGINITEGKEYLHGRLAGLFSN